MYVGEEVFHHIEAIYIKFHCNDHSIYQYIIYVDTFFIDPSMRFDPLCSTTTTQMTHFFKLSVLTKAAALVIVGVVF